MNTNSDPPVTQMVDVWITGMARSIQTTIGESPEALPWITGPGQQADVDANIEKIVVRTDTRPDISLIGAPVSLRVQAIIDYQTVVTRQMPKSVDTRYWDGKGDVQAPDITFNPQSKPVPEVEIALQRFGATQATDGKYHVDQRHWMYGITINHGNYSLGSPLMGDLGEAELRCLYDTGSHVSLISQDVAELLGLYNPSAPHDIQPDGHLIIDGIDDVPGWKLDSVVMAGQGGEYVIENAWFFIVPSAWNGAEIDPDAVAFQGAPVDVVIGSNLFRRTRLFYDGPGSTLGIGARAVSSAPSAPKNLRIIVD